MISTNKDIYLDYNATSPFSSSTLRILERGDLLFGNPSSLHHVGKSANRYMRETKAFLSDLFNLESNYKIIFHSGATEGINFFFRSIILEMVQRGVRPLFLFSAVDHSASYNQKQILESLNFPVKYFSVNRRGEFDVEEILELISTYGDKKAPYPAIVNYLLVNNETGIIWPLDQIKRIKEQTGVLVHVDAVQSIGKMKNWQQQVDYLDAFTYSAHKFGALKGVGFSFLRSDLKLAPFLYGGGQQEGLRSGTENVLGIYSIKLALEDLLVKENYQLAYQLKRMLIDMLLKLDSSLLFDWNYEQSNLNTVVIRVKTSDANTLVTVFDLAGIAISSGSACSSGISAPNRIMLNMGYSITSASSSLRLSWDPFLYSLEEWQQIIGKVQKVLQRFVG